MSKSNKENILRKKIGIAQVKLAELTTEFEQVMDLSVNVATELDLLKNNQTSATYPGLNFINLRNALCNLSENNEQNWIPSILATSGSGPWNEKELDEFLVNRNIDLFHMPDEDVNGIILGVEGWSEDDLSAQIFDREPHSLKIYTQELFIFGLIAGQDPYLLIEDEVTNEIGLNHPAIQFILNQQFTWPAWAHNSNSTDTDWDIDGTDWANESVLKQLGYNASANGPLEEERRKILTQAFQSQYLPGIESQDQKNRWGSSKSAKRLHAISHFLGWLINLQGSERPGAKEKWVSDLSWLRNEYFSRTMQFSWPVITNRKTNEKSPATSPIRQSSSKSIEPKKVKGMLVPKHALAAMIGHKTRYSLSEALDALHEYIDNNGLSRLGSPFINSDSKMFALTGQKNFMKQDLYGIVEKNLI